jgi:hypothetical protein
MIRRIVLDYVCGIRYRATDLLLYCVYGGVEYSPRISNTNAAGERHAYAVDLA